MKIGLIVLMLLTLQYLAQSEPTCIGTYDRDPTKESCQSRNTNEGFACCYAKMKEKDKLVWMCLVISDALKDGKAQQTLFEQAGYSEVSILCNSNKLVLSIILFLTLLLI